MPRDFPIGAKRLCQDEGYFETFNRDDVTLVDIRTDPIAEITPTGLRTARDEYELDVIVFATGFDALTGALLRDRHPRARRAEPARGVGGRPAVVPRPHGRRLPEPLHRHGPGQPVRAVERRHVDRAARRLDRRLHRRTSRERGARASRRRRRRRKRGWSTSPRSRRFTLFPRAASWYVGANVPGKPQVFMPYVGGVGPYRERCAAIAAAGYEGFVVKSPGASEEPTASPRAQAST